MSSAPRSDRGSAIVAAIMFSGVVLVIAGALLNMVMNRNVLFSGSKTHQYSQIATASALNELNACLYNANPWPPASAPSCPNWTCSSTGCTKTVVEGGFRYTLSATWSASFVNITSTPN